MKRYLLDTCAMGDLSCRQRSSWRIRREQSFVDQLLAVGNAVIQFYAQGRDGRPADGSPARKARTVPAEVVVSHMAPGIK
jgi:hypothetical protein